MGVELTEPKNPPRPCLLLRLARKLPSTTKPAPLPETLPPRPSSAPQSGTIWSTLSTPTSERTPDRLMESRKSLENRPLPNLGVPAAPLPVSPVSAEVVPTDPVKPLSETCAVEDECSLPSKPGENGTKNVTSTSADSP